MYIIQNKWIPIRKGVSVAENGDRQLTTSNSNWDQRNDNKKQTTSGTLKIGTKYLIESYQTGDDFSNVGAIANLTGVSFVATDTTPTDWSNSSVLEEYGTERFKLIPPGTESLLFAFLGSHASDPNDGTASIYMYMYAKEGPAQYVGDYDIIIGDMDVIKEPWDGGEAVTKKNYADQIAINGSSRWIQTPDIIQGADDQIALLRVPVFGHAGVLIEVDALSSGLTLDIMARSVHQALAPA